MKVTAFTVSHNDPLAKLLVPGGNINLTELKLIPVPILFGLLMPLRQQAKEAVTVWVGMIILHYQVKTGLPLHNGHKQEYV
jgi:hypothetical protein